MNGISEERCITEARLKKDIKNLPVNFNPGRSEILALIGKKQRFFYIPADFCIKRSQKGNVIANNRNHGFRKQNINLNHGTPDKRQHASWKSLK